MWLFLLGMLGWIAILGWAWVQVGRSLGGPVWSEDAIAGNQLEEANTGGVGQHSSDDVFTTVLDD